MSKIIILILILLSFSLLFSIGIEKKETIRVNFNGISLNCEIADTPEKRMKGLVGKTLGKNEGMLFIFDYEGRHGFWMKNMSIPLDILWIDRNLTVVHVERNVQPCLEKCKIYVPSRAAIYVLEVEANFTLVNDIQVGDKIVFNG